MKDTVYSGVPCTMYGDIYVKYGERFWSTDYRLPSDLAEQCPQIHHGDLIFTLSGETAEEIGKCAGFLGTGSVCIGGDILALRPTDKYDAEFLCYAMNSPDCIRQKAQFGQGDAVVHISQQNLSSVELHIPTRSEQRRIATSLSAVDSRLEALSSLLAKQEAIKKSTLSLLMQPKNQWGSIALGSFEFHRNNTCSRALTTSEIGTVKNIHYGDILIKFPEIVSLKTCDVDCLTEEGVRHAPDDYLQDGDIVIADTAEDETVGKMIEIQDVGDAKIVSGLHTVFLRPPKNLFVRGWLGYWMNSTYYHDQLLPLMTGIKVLSVSKAALALSDVFYPPMNEQQRIVKCLTSLDNAIADTRATIAKAQQLKRGLMRYFFG